MYLGASSDDFFNPSPLIGRDEAEIAIEVRPDFFHAARDV
jgi:hypothetical protein